MNRQGKNGIEWTDFTWNVISGCDHGCWYCYARKMACRFPKVFPNGFKPTFYPERLSEVRKYNLTHKEPVKIFVCSISDLFAPWTPEEWREKVLYEVFRSKIPHSFQLLTKNPELIPKDLEFPENVWVGTTVTGEGDIDHIDAIRKIKANRFVSFEPLLRFLEPELDGIDWVIVGKLTGARRVKMQLSWISTIMMECTRVGIPIFQKNNLRQAFPNLTLFQQFPEGMA